MSYDVIYVTSYVRVQSLVKTTNGNYLMNHSPFVKHFKEPLLEPLQWAHMQDQYEADLLVEMLNLDAAFSLPLTRTNLDVTDNKYQGGHHPK